MKPLRIIILFLLVCTGSLAQYNNRIWCFGDSAGINFNSNPPQPFQSGQYGKGVSVSISDTNGLLFYAYGNDDSTNTSGSLEVAIVKSRNNFTMQNGTNLIGNWYHDMVIIPKSVVDSTFYVFTAGVAYNFGLWYSVVDLKLNNGLGQVVQKNIQLQTFPVEDDLTMIKHGNGNDWWLIFQKWDPVQATRNNDFYTYKMDSQGISGINLQTVGTLHFNSSGDISFNSDGTKFIYAEWRGLVELYDFDRYTGIISNPVTIEPERAGNPYPYYLSAEISHSGRFLYLASDQLSYNQPSYLFQYDLSASNIAASRIIIDSFPVPVSAGHMATGPDGKIYMSCYDGYVYPYPDTMHTIVTDNLCVINQPDGLGPACDFQPFSFYLGGRRVHLGESNNPDYELGPLDTLTAVHELKPQPSQKNELKIFYHSQLDIAFINADKLKGKQYALTVFDITGKLIFKEEGNLSSQYFTKDLSMQGFAKGVYIVMLESEKERLFSRFVK